MNPSIKQAICSYVKFCKLSCLMLISQSAIADTTLYYKANAGIVNLQIKNQQAYIKNIDQSTDLLFDQKSNQVTVIKHKDHSYSVLNEAELARINTQLSGLQSAISANLNPEQHAQLNDFLGGILGSKKNQAPPKYSLKQTGPAQVGNFVCQQSQMLKDQKSIGHMCIASMSQLQVNQTDFNTLIALQAFALKAGDIMSDSLNSFLKDDVPNFNHLQFKELLIFSKIKDQPDSHFYLQKIDASPINNSFAIPSSYQQQSILSTSSLLR